MKVEFRDESDSYIYDQNLSFDPRLSPVIELKKRDSDYGSRRYEVIQGRGFMRLAADNPEAANLVVYLREIRR